VAGQSSPDAREPDAHYGDRYYRTPTGVAQADLEEPSLTELARVIKAGTGLESSFPRGKGEAGLDASQVRTWEGWHHPMALTLIAVWFLSSETHRGQQWTPALTLPPVRYGLSVLLRETFVTLGVAAICRRVQRQ
jgi:hypothetical protein